MPSGRKYEAAKEGNIIVVSLNWIDDCVDKGRWLNEKNYKVEIVSEKVEENEEENTILNEEVTLKPLKSIKESVTKQKTTAERIADSLVQVRTEQLQRLLEQTKQVLQCPKLTYALNGFSIFLHGFSRAIASQLLICITGLGGFVFDEYCSTVNFVIVGANPSLTYLSYLSQNDSNLHFVDLEWVLKCCEEQKNLKFLPTDFEDYELKKLDNVNSCLYLQILLVQVKEEQHLHVNEAEGDKQDETDEEEEEEEKVVQETIKLKQQRKIETKRPRKVVEQDTSIVPFVKESSQKKKVSLVGRIVNVTKYTGFEREEVKRYTEELGGTFSETVISIFFIHSLVS